MTTTYNLSPVMDKNAPLTVERARDLAHAMRRSLSTCVIKTTVYSGEYKKDYSDLATFGATRWVPAKYEDCYIEYTGPSGAHRIWLSVTSEARMWAHFEGFCVANNALRPQVGQAVQFTANILRAGKVLKVGPRRAQATYRQKNGEVKVRWVPLCEMYWVPRAPQAEAQVGA